MRVGKKLEGHVELEKDIWVIAYLKSGKVRIFSSCAGKPWQVNTTAVFYELLDFDPPARPREPKPGEVWKVLWPEKSSTPFYGEIQDECSIEIGSFLVNICCVELICRMREDTE